MCSFVAHCITRTPFYPSLNRLHTVPSLSMHGIAQNLLRRMLEKDPEHRIDLKAAISHPWVTVEGSIRPEGLESLEEPGWNDGGELQVRGGGSVFVVLFCFEVWVVFFVRVTFRLGGGLLPPPPLPSCGISLLFLERKKTVARCLDNYWMLLLRVRAVSAFYLPCTWYSVHLRNRRSNRV